MIENNNEKYKEIGIIDFNFECVNAEYHRPKEQVPSDITLKKPVIYLYPENTQKINIKFADSTKLTHTYPKYNENDGWEVIASPDGKLVDKDNREYYCLYWEGLDNSNKEINEGFVVEGEDAAKFLEKKLKILGLTERETNEFIIYWLPILEENKYNLIKFRLNNELNKQVPLEITPKPDTLIRIAMDFKALDSKIEIPEQRLQKIQRKGYTVVEWGGRELK
ncbi:MAG: hypothetical protein A2Y24_02730 [Clostridiales bacterium GWE2_32_10]|nr:MAG: hypothetical protein A2Y24_02730 [Clostridiales bacterium GWE2_32_10]